MFDINLFNQIRHFIKLMRPKHWIKNFLIFIPLFFSGQMLDPKLLILSIIAFVSFSFCASSIYVINDIKDVEEDRKHVKKCKRPIASGAISKSAAFVFMFVLLLIAITCNIVMCLCFESVSWLPLIVFACYYLSNIAYTIKLKHMPIIDVSMLALSYFLRVYYGSVVTGIAISDWLYLSIVSAAFFLGLGKRRNEIKTMKKDSETRLVLKYYTESFLTNMLYVFLGLGIVFYSLWSMTTNLLISVPLLIIICMKYALMIDTIADGDPVDTILSDKTFILMLLIFAALIGWAVYFR